MILEKAGFSVQKIKFQYWDPINHLLETMSGDGIRADHPPDAIEKNKEKRIYNNLIFDGFAKIMRITTVLLGLKGRDLTIYAKKRKFL